METRAAVVGERRRRGRRRDVVVKESPRPGQAM